MKNNKAFKSIMEGLSESLEYTKGNTTKARRMKLIDADEVLKEIKEYEDGCKMLLLDEDPRVIKQHIMFAPTVDPWHYPSEGEDIYNADLDWGITYFLCQMKDGKLAIAFGSCDEGCEGNVSRNIDFCGENFDVLDTDDIYAWQYIEPPKEEVNG